MESTASDGLIYGRSYASLCICGGTWQPRTCGMEVRLARFWRSRREKSTGTTCLSVWDVMERQQAAREGNTTRFLARFSVILVDWGLVEGVVGCMSTDGGWRAINLTKTELVEGGGKKYYYKSVYTLQKRKWEEKAKALSERVFL